MGVVVHAHEDAIGVEGDWEDEGSDRGALGELRGPSPTLWVEDSFVEKTQTHHLGFKLKMKDSTIAIATFTN